MIVPLPSQLGPINSEMRENSFMRSAFAYETIIKKREESGRVAANENFPFETNLAPIVIGNFIASFFSHLLRFVLKILIGKFDPKHWVDSPKKRKDRKPMVHPCVVIRAASVKCKYLESDQERCGHTLQPAAWPTTGSDTQRGGINLF